MNNKQRHLSLKVFFIQLAMLLFAAFVAYWAVGTVLAVYSACLAGLVVMVPALLFAHYMFRYQGAVRAKQIVHSFYLGEGMKLLLTILMFGLIFRFMSINPLVFFITMIWVQLSGWMVPFLTKKRHEP